MIYSIYIFLKNKKTLIENIFFYWIITSFIFISLVLKQYSEFPTQLYLVYPLIIFIILIIRKTFTPLVIYVTLSIFSILVFSNNFYTNIYPKSAMSPEQIYIVENKSEYFIPAEKVFLILDEDFHNYWYLKSKQRRKDIYFFTREYELIKKIETINSIKNKKITIMTNNIKYLTTLDQKLERRTSYKLITINNKFNGKYDSSIYDYYYLPKPGSIPPDYLKKSYFILTNIK